MWTPPGSAPPANPDTAQSVLLGAATALESAVHRAPPARPVAGLVGPGLVRLEPKGSAARSRTTEPMTTDKPKSAWPPNALRTLRHVRKCSCTEPPPHFHHPSVNPHLFVLGLFSHGKPDSLRGAGGIGTTHSLTRSRVDVQDHKFIEIA